MLVATKCDLRENNDYKTSLEKKGEKILEKEDGLELKKRINAYKYVECSAKTDTGVIEVFEEAIRAALYSGKKRKPSLIKIKQKIFEENTNIEKKKFIKSKDCILL